MSESIHVKMPHCWKSHIAAHIKISIVNLKILKTATNLHDITLDSILASHDHFTSAYAWENLVAEMIL